MNGGDSDTELRLFAWEGERFFAHQQLIRRAAAPSRSSTADSTGA